MPTEEQLERYRETWQNASYTFGNRTIQTVSTEEGTQWINIDGDLKTFDVLAPTSADEQIEIKEQKEGVDYIKDNNGKIVKLPVAVLQEEYFCSKKENGNEEEIEQYVELTILEQQNEDFNFYAYYDEAEGEFYGDEEYEDLVYYGMRSNQYECPHLYNDGYFQMYLSSYVLEKGHGKNYSYRVPIDEYQKLKMALEYFGVQIIADKKEREIEVMEEGNVKYIYDEKPSEEEIEEMLNLVNIDTFNRLIKARLCADGNTNRISEFDKEATKNYLKQWAISKYKYYKMFGNKLTLETEIEVEKEPNEYDTFRESLKSKFPLYRNVFNCISINAMVENTIRTKTAHYIASEYFEDPKVKNNMSFTKFISLYGNKEIDTEVSKFYQEKGKAHLVISIDPVDYLTVSINKSGWRSCHHFINGEYRNAGLSYMNDNTSLVSYRSSGEEEYYLEGKKIKWNSKSWRQMIYVSQENSAIVFSRQYPYGNDKLTFQIRQMMEECVSNFFKGSNKWTIYRKPNNTNVSVDYGNGAILYNDVYNGFDYQVVKAKDDEARNIYSHIPIGSKVYGVFSGNQLERAHSDIW